MKELTARFFSLGMLLLVTGLGPGLQAQLPDKFNDELVGSGWPSVVGITFDDNGRIYAWAKQGLVLTAENGVLHPAPLLDIQEECANWGDHGLLGFALHPNFLSNGYFYVMYAVDRHHLLYHGTSQYSPSANITHQASIGRVVRYTADPASDFKTVVPGSRHVLIGQTIQSGLPLLHGSHGVGTLAFGKDGTLLISMGDGGSYAGTDVGGDEAGAYATQALEDGIITEKENVGAFRAQQIQSLNGKILRIDPSTGAGIPSNPFYDPADPFAPRSRVWAMGLRNPYRFTIQPETGSHNPEDGDPGVLWIGDVGWAYWEEINRADRGGLNFGWPVYEGLRTRWQYHGRPTRNPEAPNPLAWTNGCLQDFFYFQDLLQEDTEQASPFFPNPCDQTLSIPSDLHTFTHTRPRVAWSNIEWNTEEQDTHVPGFDDDGQAIIHSLKDPGSPVAGEMFTGKCSVGGVWVEGNNWPEAYQHRLYGGDFTGWFRGLSFDDNQQLDSVAAFFTNAANVVDMKLNPVDGCLYYVEYAFLSDVRRICFGGNPAPTAIIEADKHYGPGPLEVNFSARNSFDPQGEPLSYLWDFGDGVTSTDTVVSHLFASVNGQPRPWLVSLTVTDTAGNRHADYLTISVDNTPPVVSISSFEDGATYPMSGVTELPLKAEATDNEQDAASLEYGWQIFFHHNTHNHPEPIDPSPETVAYLFPEGCGEEEYWYRIRVTVRDAGGLEAYDERELFPFCGGPLVEFDTIEAKATGELVRLQWYTLSEWPGTVFTVERSVDKIRFEPVGSVNAAGSASGYQLEDRNPAYGSAHYRVKALLPDGRFDFSPLAQAEFPGVEGVRVQPVPVEEVLRVVFEEVVNKAEFRVFSLDGRLLRSFSWADSGQKREYELRLSDLPSGLYLYEATDGRSRYAGKLLKQ